MKPFKVCFLILAVFGINGSGQETYKCDFENDLCSFLTNTKSWVQWEIGTGNHLNSTDTGPFIDHTLGNVNGSYLFVDVGDFETGQASLNTIILKTDYCVRFFYHMYAEDIGDLKVSTQNSARTSVFTENFYKKNTKGDRWKEARFRITASEEMQETGYEVVWTSKNYVVTKLRGHIALDDIELKPGQCEDSSGSATQLHTFDDYDYGYTATRLGSIEWEWKAVGQTTTKFQGLPGSDNTLGTELGGYWIAGTEAGNTLSKQVGDAILTSPVYTNPKSSSNCLLFYYYMHADDSHWFWGDVKTAHIQAYISYPASNDQRTWLVTKAKNVTLYRQWTYVEAKAEITEYFQIQFRVNINSLVEALFALDDIQLLPGRCPEAGYCDFEEDRCSWMNGKDLFTWIRKSGSSSFARGVGPKTDKTLGTDKGNYVVFGIKNKYAGETAFMESELFAPETGPLCLSFWYQMKGVDIGTLEVTMRQENVGESILWFLSGERGNDWNEGRVSIPPSIRNNKIVFKGICGGGDDGFMALDDIRIRQGEKCDLSPPDAYPRYDLSHLSCTFDDLDLCSWTRDKKTLPWKFGEGSLVESIGPKEPVNEQGHYIFVSSLDDSFSGNKTVARIMSPTISPTISPTVSPSCFHHSLFSCFSFYYHMFGTHVGELRVYRVAMHPALERRVIWRRRGTQPDKWFQYRESINNTEGDYRIEIEAEGGTGFSGNIAIDDITTSLGECNNISETCDFESSLCGWTVEPSSTGAFSWMRVAGQGSKGPAQDHTTLNNDGLVLQAVANADVMVEEITNFVSPMYGARWGPHCLTFWYYRSGRAIGKISVLTRSGDEETLHWSATRDVGKFWYYGQVTIDEPSSLQMMFQAEKGSNHDYEMAIDDILIKDSKCGAPAACTFNNDYCSYFNNGSSDFAWLLGTGRVVNPDLVYPPSVDLWTDDMYAYVDMTSPNLKEGQSAVLVSEIVEIPYKGVSCLTFNYYKDGEESSELSVGTMILDVSEQGMQYKTTYTFSTKGNTEKTWFELEQNISALPGSSIQIFFRAVRGNEPGSFIAVDDISLFEGKCQVPTIPPPATVTEMPVTSLSCDFEEGDFCSWMADNGKLRWKMSNNRIFKPKFDHTQGNYMGHYAYLKGDDNNMKEGSMTSSPASPEWMGQFCFSFWYIMNVEGKSSLNVSAHYRSAFWKPLEYVSYWSREGDYGYKWRYASVQIESSEPSPNLRITGSVESGVIAVDDFAAAGGPCPASKICNFDNGDGMCGYTQDSKNTIDWAIKAGEDDDVLYKISDHTTRSIKGNYLYAAFNPTTDESSQLSRIYSPKYAASASSCVTFYYHIYNVSNLSLNTYLAMDNGLSDPQWTVTLDQGPLWHGARFSAVSEAVSWQVVLEVTVGTHGYGQVAIDDISIENGECSEPGYCDFETEDCLWEDIRVLSKEKSPWKLEVTNVDKPTDLLTDDFDWTRHIAADYFGPSEDNTLGSSQGFYLLLDTRYSRPGDKAVYLSERLSTSSGVCLKLWYSMPNYKNGASLVIYSSNDFKTAEQVKGIKDITNQVWTQALMTVVPAMASDVPTEHFWIFLSGVTGNHTFGYVAVDDISISEGVCEESDDFGGIFADSYGDIDI